VEVVLHLCSEGGVGTPSQIREWMWYSISSEKVEVASHLLLGKRKWHHISPGRVRGEHSILVRINLMDRYYR